jgi:hypothetical protein
MQEHRDSTSYLLGQSEEEASRLQDQSRRTEDETRAVLAKVGLGKGPSVLM